MGRLDDMLFELALGAGKPRYWAEQLRKEVRQLERSAVNWENVGAGIKVPWIEAGGGRFDILPHEGGSFLGAPTIASQSIPNAAWTNVVFHTPAQTGASWSKGMRLDTTNWRIYFEGIPRDAVVIMLGWVSWANDTTGQRGVQLIADDGSTRTVMHSAAGLDEAGQYTHGPEIVHMRSVPSSQTYYYMKVYQSSGGALDLAWRGMTIMRLR